MLRINLRSMLILSCLLFLVAGISRAAETIVIDGSSTVFPIAEALAEEYRNKNRRVRIAIGISGTGGGFKKFCKGESAINAASRRIKDTEIKACAKSGLSFIELPIAYDGIVVVVNKKNDWLNDISIEGLKKIWSPEAQDNIENWRQIDSTFPDKKLLLFGAGVDSGTYDYFTKVVVGREHSSRGDYTSSEDDNVLVQGVAGSRTALGFFGYAYYHENRDKLKALSIRYEGSVVGPSRQSISTNTYKPLSRPLFLYISSKYEENKVINGMMQMLLSVQGGELIDDTGYISLPQELQNLVLKRFQNRVKGSMFADKHNSNSSLKELLGQ